MNIIKSKIIIVLSVAAITIVLFLSLKFTISHAVSPSSFGLSGYYQQPVDVLFVGSSHVRKSYDIAQIESETGYSAYSIAYNGFDPVLMLPLLKDLLANKNHGIKFLVVDAYSWSIMQEPSVKDERIIYHSPNELKLKYFDLLNSPVMNFGVKENFQLFVSGYNDYILSLPFSKYAAEMTSYRGGYRLYNLPGLSQAEFDNLEPSIKGDASSKASSGQVAALENILTLLASVNIDLVFVETPLPSSLDRFPVIGRSKQLIRDTIERKGQTYIDGDKLIDSTRPHYFSDNNHLSGEGAKLFSSAISQYIDSRIIDAN